MPARFTSPDGFPLQQKGVREESPAAALQAAELLRGQGRFAAACTLVRGLVGGQRLEPDTFRQALAFLGGSGRQDLAFECSEERIAGGSTLPEDFGHAARLAVQVGQFELARERYRQGLDAGLDPHRWKVAEGLAICQRYTSDEHPDLALFDRWLRQSDIDGAARARVMYAQGKANDDLGRYRKAAACWREANAIMATQTHWSEEAWHQAVALAAGPWGRVPESVSDWVPVFVVGMPRSGTTLVAQLLSACPEVRNRDEQMWIPQLFERIMQAKAGFDPAVLRDAAAWYRRMMVQDDAPAHWYIDKQTFNFLHLGLIAALCPQAEIVHCVRSPRDAALSIWSQHFGGTAAAFMYRFDSIATVTDCSRQRMAHWKEHLRLPIHTVVYEELVAAPEKVVADLHRSLGLPEPASDAVAQAADAPGNVVTTASMWQVRQPITTKSVGRWRHYADYLPELVERFATDP